MKGVSGFQARVFSFPPSFERLAWAIALDWPGRAARILSLTSTEAWISMLALERYWEQAHAEARL
jgi:hypothetical protein